MTKFAIGPNKDKLLKRAAMRVFATELEAVDSGLLKRGDIVIFEDEDEPGKLIKSFASACGVTLAKASSQLPVTAVEEEILKRRLRSGEQAAAIAKSEDLDVLGLVALAMEAR